MPDNSCNKCDCYFTCIGCCESVCFPLNCNQYGDCERCKKREYERSEHDNENVYVLDEMLFGNNRGVLETDRALSSHKTGQEETVDEERID